MTSRNRRRGSLVPAVLALALALAACGGDNNDDTARGTTTETASPAANQVTMRLIAFKPESLAVAAGTTVTWTQKDAGTHTVTSGTVTQGTAGVTTAPDGTFDSGSLATDATFEFTFEAAGTFPYFCNVHPATMRGEVRVT
jgi:plastocyanin